LAQCLACPAADESQPRKAYFVALLIAAIAVLFEDAVGPTNFWRTQTRTSNASPSEECSVHQVNMTISLAFLVQAASMEGCPSLLAPI
jgi:hypothetical protein